LKKEYQHSVGLTVELDKVLLIIGSLSFVEIKEWEEYLQLRHSFVDWGTIISAESREKSREKENERATLRGLKKEYQHFLGLTVELDKVLLIIGSLSFVGHGKEREKVLTIGGFFPKLRTLSHQLSSRKILMDRMYERPSEG
jgi:hypothetical protein